MSGLCEIPSCWGIPQMSVTGFAQFGEHGGQAVSGPRAWRNEAFQWQDSFYHTVGAHSLKFGATVRRHRDNFPEAIYPRGQYYVQRVPDRAAVRRLPARLSTKHAHQHRHLLAALPQHGGRTVDSGRLARDAGTDPEPRACAGNGLDGRSPKDNSISTVIFEGSTARLITAKDPAGYPQRAGLRRLQQLRPANRFRLHAEIPGRQDGVSRRLRHLLPAGTRQYVGGPGDQRSVHPANYLQSGH